MVARLDDLWNAAAPIPHLELLSLRDAPDAPPRNVLHADLLALDPATRARMRGCSDWRIHGFHYLDPAARRLFFAPRLRRFVSTLFGRRARPFAAINFMAGSQQSLHQDMAVFHIHPRNYLVGAWIACEDIAPESGPLVLHAGSHRVGMFPEFSDYPQTNLRTVDLATQERYHAWADEVATRHPRHEFLARKGQVLLWHGMLLHGGAPVTRRGTSRKSMVIHYTVRGADRAREVRGPFNW
jgi:ectoine hydroxylase-related dioxygenase (phytanoyl-CoA dioxygenase family)